MRQPARDPLDLWRNVDDVVWREARRGGTPAPAAMASPTDLVAASLRAEARTRSAALAAATAITRQVRNEHADLVLAG